MKVLMLVNRLNVGGTETYILSLAKQLRNRGVHVGVAAYGGPLVPMFLRSGIRVHLIPRTMRSRPVAYLRGISEKNGYRVIHAHDTFSFRWISGWKGTDKRHTFIMTLHGKYVGRIPMLQAAQRARTVVASSPQMVTWAMRQGISPGKIVLLPNGIDTVRFKPDDRQHLWRKRINAGASYPLIVYAGRFQAPKHRVAEKVIAAAGIVLVHRPKARFILTGPGRHLSSLRRSASGIQRRHGTNALLVRPALQDIRKLYWASDLVIGTGRVALEAMACGKPVLAVGVSGYAGPIAPQSLRRSIRIHFGDHGSIAPATPKRIASGILQMLERPMTEKSLSAFGRKIVQQRFSIVGMTRSMLRLYQA